MSTRKDAAKQGSNNPIAIVLPRCSAFRMLERVEEQRNLLLGKVQGQMDDFRIQLQITKDDPLGLNTNKWTRPNDNRLTTARPKIWPSLPSTLPIKV